MQKNNHSAGLRRRSKYRDLQISIPAALFAGQFLVSFGQEENFFRLFFLPRYYPAIIFSMVMAWLIFFMINRSDRFLEKKYSWETNSGARLSAQIGLGVAAPILIDFFAASAYFASYKVSIFDSVFFKFYLPMIFLYIVVVNGYYNIEYIAKAREDYLAKHNAEFGNEEEETELVKDEEELKLEAEIRAYAEENDVAYIATAGNYYIARNSAGKSGQWVHSLSKSLSALPSEMFFQVSKSCIVRRDIIARTIEHANGQRVTAVLKDSFNEKFKISIKNTMRFNKWYKSPPIKEE